MKVGDTVSSRYKDSRTKHGYIPIDESRKTKEVKQDGFIDSKLGTMCWVHSEGRIYLIREKDLKKTKTVLVEKAHKQRSVKLNFIEDFRTQQ
jgi:hypothetical protein